LLKIKTADHIRRQGNVRGRGSLRSCIGVWSPLGDLARMDLANRNLARRRLKLLADQGKAIPLPLGMRALLQIRNARREAACRRICSPYPRPGRIGAHE